MHPLPCLHHRIKFLVIKIDDLALMMTLVQTSFDSIPDRAAETALAGMIINNKSLHNFSIFRYGSVIQELYQTILQLKFSNT